MKNPLVAICLSFCLGIVAAQFFLISLATFIAILFLPSVLFLILSIVFLDHDNRFTVTILCLACLLGFISLFNSYSLPSKPKHIARLTPYKGKAVELTGTIKDEPVLRKRGVWFVLSSEKLKEDGKEHDVSGQVLVKFFSKPDIDSKKLSYGSRLFLEGTLYKPPNFSEEFNYADYLKRKNIYSILSVKKTDNVKLLGRKIGNPIKNLAFIIRRRIKSIYKENLSPFSSAVVSAVILGERQDLDPAAKEALIKSGTVHVISISGLHLGIIAFIILLILKILQIPRKIRFIFTIAMLVIYCIMTGARIPVVRSTIMAAVLLFGYLLERESNVYNSLSLAALLILIVNPKQLFDAGFQLSFLSVISIVWLTPKIVSRFPERCKKIKWARFLIYAFSASLACWIGLAGLIAYYFRIISPITVLANMIIIPYMSIIIASAFSVAITGLIFPPLAALLGSSTEFFISILFKINSLLIAIPGAFFRLEYMPFAYVFAYYLLVISAFNLGHFGPKKPL